MILGFEMSTGYEIGTFLVTEIKIQRKTATKIGILKRKPDILLIILPDAINIKCILSQKFPKNLLKLSSDLVS